MKFYFATGKSDVPSGAQEALKDVLVAALGGKKVVVSGYHDSTGNAAFNEELSKQRALAVRAVLQGSACRTSKSSCANRKHRSRQRRRSPQGGSVAE